MFWMDINPIIKMDPVVFFLEIDAPRVECNWQSKVDTCAQIQTILSSKTSFLLVYPFGRHFLEKINAPNKKILTRKHTSSVRADMGSHGKHNPR